MITELDLNELNVAQKGRLTIKVAELTVDDLSASTLIDIVTNSLIDEYSEDAQKLLKQINYLGLSQTGVRKFAQHGIFASADRFK